MLRTLNTLLVVAVLAAGFVIYSLEHRTRGAEQRIAAINDEMAKQRDAMKLLNVEWSYLTRPSRLERIAQKGPRVEAGACAADRQARRGGCAAGATAGGKPGQFQQGPAGGDAEGVAVMAPDEHGRADMLKGRNRLRLVMTGFAVCFVAIGLRIGQFSLLEASNDSTARPHVEARIPRPNITDRHGQVLASDLPIASLYANPRQIIDVDEAVELLTSTLPGLSAREVRHRLAQDKAFVWLKREITPAQKQEVFQLGIPGLYFRDETRRIYPMGRLAAHVLGFVDVDSRGLAGVEKFLDDQGALYTASLAEPATHTALPVELSIDASVEGAVNAELSDAIAHFKAKAGAGVVLNIKTGEVLAAVSLPNYNPNNPKEALLPDRLNRITGATYELGSVIKAVTFAMAFEAGVTDLNGKYDARQPLAIGHARIHDYHATHRILTVPEVFVHSSNIGTARMALDVGIEAHQAFLRKMGLFDRLVTELPEAAAPILPKRWGKLTTATAAFGHAFAIEPLQGVSVIGAFLNHGLSGAADLPQARRHDGQGAGAAGGVGGYQPEDALSLPPQRGGGDRQEGRCAGLSGRRQNGDVGKSGEWPLQQQTQPQLVHRRLSHGRSHLCDPHHDRRAAAVAGDPWLRHGGMERGTHRRHHHQAHRTVAGHRAATGRRGTRQAGKDRREAGPDLDEGQLRP